MDQFAQLRDQIKEFEKRQAQVLVVLPQEASYIRQWLRSRDKWGPTISDWFKEPGSKRPWVDSRGAGAVETVCPVLADPSFTVSASYGVAFQDFFSDGNKATTFVIDPEGVIRFEHREGDNDIERPSIELLLKTIDTLKR